MRGVWSSILTCAAAAIILAAVCARVLAQPGCFTCQQAGGGNGGPAATPTVVPAPGSTQAAQVPPTYITLGIGYGTTGTVHATPYATSIPAGFLDYEAHPGPGMLNLWTGVTFPGTCASGGSSNDGCLNDGVFLGFSAVAHFQLGTPNESSMQKWPYYHKREQDFYHNGDAAFLTGTPSASGTCIWNWQADLRPNAGKYQLVNGATGAVISTVTGTTFTESGLTNGTPVYRYLNTVFVDSGATTINAAITASTSAQTAVYTPTATTQVIRGDDWLSIGGAHPEVVRVLNQPTGGGAPGTTNDTSHFVAVFTQNHAIGDSISEIEPYDGTNNLDATSSTYPNVTNTFGTPLAAGTPGPGVNADGFVLASCTPSASAPTTTAAAILSKFAMTLTNNPEPQTSDPTPAPTPASGSTISISGSIEETASASAQATPAVQYVYAGSSFTLTQPTQTWTSSSAGLSNNTLIWTINASTTLTTTVANGDSPIDIRVCIPASACTVFTQFWNFQVGNRTFCIGYSNSNPTCYEQNPNAYQRALDNQDLFDDEIRSTLGNPTPRPAGGVMGGFVGEELHDAFGGSGAGIDIQNSVDTVLPSDLELFTGLLKFGQNMAAWFSAGGGTNAGCTVSGCAAWNSNWGAWAFQDGNMIGNGNPYGTATKCANCVYANASTNRTWRMTDELFLQASATTYNPASAWVGAAENVLQDGVQSTPITDFITEAAGDNANGEYLALADFLLLQHGATKHGSILKFGSGNFDSTNNWLADTYPNEYVPIGWPIVDPVPIPNPAASPTTAMSAIYNATAHLFERDYSNGLILLCAVNGVDSNPCGTWTAPNGYTAWALVPNTAVPMFTVTGVVARSYVAITSWNVSSTAGVGGQCNTAANCAAVIITYQPY